MDVHLAQWNPAPSWLSVVEEIAAKAVQTTAQFGGYCLVAGTAVKLGVDIGSRVGGWRGAMLFGAVGGACGEYLSQVYVFREESPRGGGRSPRRRLFVAH